MRVFLPRLDYKMDYKDTFKSTHIDPSVMMGVSKGTDIKGTILERKEPEEKEISVIKIESPSLRRLPYVNPDTIRSLFKKLSVENVLLLFKRVLLDTSNIFVSDDATDLVNCCEAIKALIFPFKFELVYVPHLPKILAERVETPFIYMLGIKGKKLYDEIRETIKDGTYIIELDTDKIQQIPHTSTIINRYGTTKEKIDEDLPDLPFKHLSQLRKSIKDIGRKAHETNNLRDDEVEKIRQAFYKFFVCLFRYYPDKKQQKDWKDAEESKKG